ncbi:MAG: diguanylate cyclase [Thermoanaerobaculia bacterium]
MHLDPPTLLVVGTFVGVLMTLVVAITDLGMRERMPGLREIAASFAIHTVATFLFALQVTPVPRFVSVFLANAFFVAGFAVFFVGVRRFVGAPPRVDRAAALALASLAVVAYGTFAADSIRLRTVFGAVPELVLYPVAAVDLLRSRVPARRAGRFLVAGILSVDVLVAGLRTVFAVVADAPKPVAVMTGIQLSYVALHVVAFAALGVGVLLTANEKLREDLEWQAWHDPLAGAYTRRIFFELVEKERHRSLRSGQPFALLMLDLDHFKAWNDRHGHQAGDRFLAAAAAAVRAVLRPSDVVGRYGGEEFVVLLPGASVEGAARAGERLRRAVAAVEIGPDVVDRGTASIGVAAIAGPDDDVASILRRADPALYRAKERGRNRVEAEAPAPA